MNTLRRMLGTALLLVGGIVVYDLAVQDALIAQTLPLLLILASQALLGGFTGALMRSWRAVAVAPASFAAGFLAAAPLQTNGLIPGIPTSGDSAALSGLAGGSLLLGTIFVLTLLCGLLAVGSAIGTTRGIRRAKQATWRRAHTPRPAPVIANLRPARIGASS